MNIELIIFAIGFSFAIGFFVGWGYGIYSYKKELPRILDDYDRRRENAISTHREGDG